MNAAQPQDDGGNTPERIEQQIEWLEDVAAKKRAAAPIPTKKANGHALDCMCEDCIGTAGKGNPVKEIGAAHNLTQGDPLRKDRSAAQTCGKLMRGVYGAPTTCARPAGHIGKHDPIWNHKDWSVSAAKPLRRNEYARHAAVAAEVKDCTGRLGCPARLHIHGCGMDDGSNCTWPAQHEEPKP